MKNFKKLSRGNLRQIAGGGPGGKPLQSPDGGYYCLPSQGQLCLVGCTPTCVNGACNISMCLDINPV